MNTQHHSEPLLTLADTVRDDQPIHTYHIHLTGIVQGVGFRPLAYTLAKQYHINGVVSNGNDGLHINICTTEKKARSYYTALLNTAPAKAIIASSSMYETTGRTFTDFTITESSSADAVSIPLTPDYAPCPQCLQEMYDKNNRRYLYPFITCTQCGPRYSILQQLPYDRSNTTMHEFDMCAACSEEYHNLQDRRYFSQTNSCTHCGVQLTATDSRSRSAVTGNKTVSAIIDENLRSGKIVALKGVGGYVLLCDAANAVAIQNLRDRKHRPAKPFAILCGNMEAVHSLGICSTPEQEYLQNDAAPILLLKAQKTAAGQIALDAIAPGLQTVGVMLPNSPLLHLVSTQFGKPLICTSGNISGSPIIFDDDEAVSHLSSVADIIVSHNRKIVVPQDDSVIRISRQQQAVVIRRARGLSPSLTNIHPISSQTIMATGALLKSSIAIQHHRQYYISQYLGNTIGLESQQYYQHTWQQLTGTLQAHDVKSIVSDKHPGYFTSQFGKACCEQSEIPRQVVQHHKAHLAAVLAENDLVGETDPVLCFIADGTGLGDDGNTWGGEFFRYQDKRIERCSHFAYFPVLFGDKMAREPRLSALAIAHDSPGAGDILQKKFTGTEWQLYSQMLKKHTGMQSSSLGRIFDAVASLLDITDKQSYEAEAAIKLEDLALSYLERVNWQFEETYLAGHSPLKPLPTLALVNGVISDINQGKDRSFIAAKFHRSIVSCIAAIAERESINKIAFSGGVFQNTVLVDLVKIHLQQKFRLFFHQRLSPNDENIAFGQLVYYDNGIDNKNSSFTINNQ